jgi:hypothetical protein
VDSTVSVPLVRTNPEKSDPKSGAVQLEWNVNGTLLMARFGARQQVHSNTSHNRFFVENSPTALHIYAFPSPSEPFHPSLRTVILHNQPVLHARWNPIRTGSLLLCCGTGAVYTWNADWEDAEHNVIEMAECIGVPTG